MNSARTILIFYILLSCFPAFAQGTANSCGQLTTGFGPFDYRTERGEKLSMVEGAHFLALY